MCEDGDVIVRGINTANLIAGYIEICIRGEWGALCGTFNWNDFDARVTDARVTCRQLGFSADMLTLAR